MKRWTAVNLLPAFARSILALALPSRRSPNERLTLHGWIETEVSGQIQEDLENETSWNTQKICVGLSLYLGP